MHVDRSSRELLLSVDLALEGDPSKLNRFGHHVVTLVTTQQTGIAGKTLWDPDVFDATGLTQGEAAQLFRITANYVEEIHPHDGFSYIQYTPLAYGVATGFARDDGDFVVPYEIPGVPYNRPLVVRVEVGTGFYSPGERSAAQIAGPEPVVLTVTSPGVSGVDFRVTAIPPPPLTSLCRPTYSSSRSRASRRWARPVQHARLHGDAIVHWPPYRIGRLSRFSVTVPTAFRLAGFDQRVPPAFPHSTVAFVTATGPSESGTFQYAVDSVTAAGFDSGGTYFVNLDVAIQPPPIPPDLCSPIGCFVMWMIEVCSFVLVFEPPLPKTPPGPVHASVRRSAVGVVAQPLAPLLAEKLGVVVVPDTHRPEDGGPGGCGSRPLACR